MTTKEREIARKKVEGHEPQLSPELLKAYKNEHDLEDKTIEQEVNDKETVKKRAFEDRLLKGLPVELKVSLSIKSPPDVPIERKLMMVHGIIERIRDTGSLAVGVNGVIEGVEDFREIEEKWISALEEEREKARQARKRLRRTHKKIMKEAEQRTKQIEEQGRIALEEEKKKTEQVREEGELSIKTMEKINSDLAKLNVELREEIEKPKKVIKETKTTKKKKNDGE